MMHGIMDSALCYIDPGTGSMLFTLLIGAVSTAYFMFRKLAMRAKFLVAGGRSANADTSRHPIVIFSDDKRYWNVFKPICDELELRGQAAVYWTASADDPALDESYEHVQCEFIGEGNQAYARLNVMSASICLATTPGLGVYQWKRSKEVGEYVHIFHSVGTAAGYRMFGLDFYDSVLIAGDYQVQEIRALEELRGIQHKNLARVGCTYLDAMMDRARALPTAKDHPFCVLVAPSWGPTSLLCAYGERLLDALLATGYKVVVRPHPQSKTADKEVLDRLMRAYPDAENFSWNFDNDNFEVLANADAMITDFSGVVFDYALVFDRPILYTEGSYVDDPYDSAWLVDQGPLWKFKTYPKLGRPLDEAQLPHVREVLQDLVADEDLLAVRQQVREEAWCCQGQSVKLTVDYLIARCAVLAVDSQNNDSE